MSEMMKGEITISQPQYGSGKKKIRLTFRDKLSSTAFLEVEVDYATFAEALTGASYQPCEFILRPARVGKIREHKREIVPCGAAYNLTDEGKAELLKPFEVDGWRGSKDDIGNSHRRTDSGYSVDFIRHVDPEASK